MLREMMGLSARPPASPCLLLPSPGSFSQALLEEEGLWERRSLELEETVQSGIRLNKFSSEISSCVQGEMRKGAGWLRAAVCSVRTCSGGGCNLSALEGSGLR